MAKMISVLDKESQIRSLASELKLKILSELINGSSTCQKLSEIFDVSKQKIHYNLMQLLDESLIEIDDEHNNNNKEIYYCAAAKNYVLDFSLGQHVKDKKLYNRELLNTILEKECNFSLSSIAAKLLDDSLKVKPTERLLIITGNYNMPLVEKLIIEAARRNVKTHILYQGIDFYKTLYKEFSLTEASNWYDYAIRLYKDSDVVLILNGETRFIVSPEDKMKRKLQQKHRLNINKLNSGPDSIRMATMIGFLSDSISEDNLKAEIEFWCSLNIDYDQLQKDTLSLCNELLKYESCRIKKGDTDFTFSIDNISCEYGSFGDYPYQSTLINLPGGEVLLEPKDNTLNGTIVSPCGFAMGKTIKDVRLELKNNEIVKYSAGSNENVLQKAIEYGGSDGRKVALICIGTNSNLSYKTAKNSMSRHKTKGMMSIYWGNNAMVNGKVRGNVDWSIEIDNPEFIFS